MVTTQLALVLVAALISLAFGVRYFVSKEFMPYHAAVAGKSWAEIDSGMRTVVLGLFKIAAAGFCSYGISLLWLEVPLRDAPSARTPVLPAAAVLALGILAGILGLLA